MRPTDPLPLDIQPRLLRRLTARRLLQTLCEGEPRSRADLVRCCGLSAPTVSKVAAELLARGFLEEGDAPEGVFGRPGRRLRPARESAQVIGVVLDAHDCQVVGAGLDGRLHEMLPVRQIPTPPRYEALIAVVAEAVTEMICQRPGVRTLGVGISTPGLINHRLNEVAISPNLHQTDGRPVARDLSDALRQTRASMTPSALPAVDMPVIMVQELNGLCLAEAAIGGAKGLADFALLDMSTGLGLGVMSGGQLLTGHSGLAGELGHVTMQPRGRRCGCGNHGCLETLATDTALAYAVSERLGRPVTIGEVLHAPTDSSIAPTPVEIDTTAEYMAIAMAAVINLFNPNTLFVHGRLLSARADLFDDVRRRTARRALAPSFADCRIVPAIGNKSVGAVAAIIHHLLDALGPHWA